MKSRSQAPAPPSFPPGNPRNPPPSPGSRLPCGSELPRERLLRHGPQVLSDAELLAVVLRTGVPGCHVIELSHGLLAQFGGIRGLLGAERSLLTQTRGLGPAKAALLSAVLELARRSMAEELSRMHSLNNPELTQAYCAALLGHHTVEVCVALYLDNQLRLIASEELSRGTLAQTAVYPREIVRAALKYHAATVILAHNHPSGLAEPSAADRQLTRQVLQALQLVDIRLADHIIVAGHQTISMARLGQL